MIKASAYAHFVQILRCCHRMQHLDQISVADYTGQAIAPELSSPNRIAGRSSAPAGRGNGIAGFTLVEVMIAAILFVGMALSITAFFLQNNKMSMALRYRTNATTAALNILEQIRVLDYDSLNTLYTTSAPIAVTNAFVRVLITDPNAPDHTSWTAPDPTSTTTPGFGADKIPLKYQNLDVVINVRDGVIKNSAWNVPALGLPLESSATALRMPMRFWLTLNYNNAAVSTDTGVPAGDVFEIVLVYQWQQPGSAATSPWESGTVRAVVQKPTPRSTED
jgi:hypothetical protein